VSSITKYATAPRSVHTRVLSALAVGVLVAAGVGVVAGATVGSKQDGRSSVSRPVKAAPKGDRSRDKGAMHAGTGGAPQATPTPPERTSAPAPAPMPAPMVTSATSTGTTGVPTTTTTEGGSPVVTARVTVPSEQASVPPAEPVAPVGPYKLSVSAGVSLAGNTATLSMTATASAGGAPSVGVLVTFSAPGCSGAAGTTASNGQATASVVCPLGALPVTVTAHDAEGVSAVAHIGAIS
jgi:hypothetical protein